MNKNVYRIVLVSVAALLVLHMFTVQAARRNIAEDTRTSVAINTLSEAVDAMYEADREIPDSLSSVVLDDEDKKGVENAELTYERESSRSYKICGEFNYERDGYDYEYNPFTAGFGSFDESVFNVYGSSVDTFTHDEGKVCFDYSAYGGYEYDYDRFDPDTDASRFDFDSSSPGEFDDATLEDLEALFSDPEQLEDLNTQLQ